MDMNFQPNKYLKKHRCFHPHFYMFQLVKE